MLKLYEHQAEALDATARKKGVHKICRLKFSVKNAEKLSKCHRHSIKDRNVIFAVDSATWLL